MSVCGKSGQVEVGPSFGGLYDVLSHDADGHFEKGELDKALVKYEIP